jgi:alkaline phosphatase D
MRSLGLAAWLIVIGSVSSAICSDHVTKIAFGSCNDVLKWDKSIQRDSTDPAMNATVWLSTVTQWHPDLFIWLGDVVYADRRSVPFFWNPAEPQGMSAMYQHMKSHPSYQSLLSSVDKVIGVWDDHDYGKNDGGAEYQSKDAAKQIYLDFIDEPAQSQRRTQQGGIYASYTIGKVGQRVKIILLDVRFGKEGSYGSGDLLFSDQWDWLEKELSPTGDDDDWQLLLIGTGIQFLPVRKPIQEKWGTFPDSRERLLRLLHMATIPRKYGDAHRRAVVLSGDVHYGEFLVSPSQCFFSYGRYANIYEVTSSGLTHSCGTASSSWMQPTQSFACQFALNHIMKTAQHIEGSYVDLRNWGSIEVDWEKNSVTFSLRHVDRPDAIFFQSTLSLNASKDFEIPSSEFNCDKINENASFLHLIPFEHWKWAVWFIFVSFAVGIPTLCVRLCCCRKGAMATSVQKRKLKTT